MQKINKLTKRERLQIYKLIKFNYSRRQIAKELNRSHSTIVRELNRNKVVVNGNEDFYTQAEYASLYAKHRRIKASKGKMRLKSKEIRWYTEFHLKIGWSPETIAGKLTSLGYKISYEAIYQFINFEMTELKPYLLIAGRSKRRRQTKRRHRKPVGAAQKQSIEIRPEAANQRLEIGHFELDAMHGQKGKSVIQNKIDRKSRKIFLDKVFTLEAKGYSKTFINRMEKERLKGVIKTITQDNGSEHAEHKQIDSTLGTDSFFTHPYCSSERGTVEVSNKVLRRFLPKGCDFDDIPDDFIVWVEDYFNNKPMKVLQFKTPNQVWLEELKVAA